SEVTRSNSTALSKRPKRLPLKIPPRNQQTNRRTNPLTSRLRTSRSRGFAKEQIMKVITIAFILAVTAAGATAQQLYEIRCRGGGLTISSTTGQYLPSGQRMHVTVKFK